jgi:hypothetical protein
MERDIATICSAGITVFHRNLVLPTRPGVKMTTKFKGVLRLRMSGTTPPPSLYDFTVCTTQILISSTRKSVILRSGYWLNFRELLFFSDMNIPSPLTG